MSMALTQTESIPGLIPLPDDDQPAPMDGMSIPGLIPLPDDDAVQGDGSATVDMIRSMMGGSATPNVASATQNVAGGGFFSRLADSANAFGIGVAQRVPGVVADLALTARAAEAASRNPARAILPTIGSAIDLAMNPAGRIAGTAATPARDAMSQVAGGLSGRVPGLASQMLGQFSGGAESVRSGVDAAALQGLPARALDTFSPEGLAYTMGQSAVDMAGSVAGGIVGGMAGGPVGSVVGAGAPILASETGGNVRQNFEAIKAQYPGISDEDALTEAFVPAVAAAIPSAALDAMSGGEAAVARELLQTAARGQAKRMLARLGRGAMEVGKSALEEGGTEMIQGAISDVGQNVAAPKGGPTTMEDVRQFAIRRGQEGFAGAAMGGVMTAAAKVPGALSGRLGPSASSRPSLDYQSLPDVQQPAQETLESSSPNPTTITPFPGTVGGEEKVPGDVGFVTSDENGDAAARAGLAANAPNDTRLTTLIAAIEADPENTALQAALDEYMGGEGGASVVGELGSPANVEAPNRLGVDGGAPEVVGRFPELQPGVEVGEQGGLAGRGDDLAEAVGKVNAPTLVEPRGDGAGAVQAGNLTPEEAALVARLRSQRASGLETGVVEDASSRRTSAGGESTLRGSLDSRPVDEKIPTRRASSQEALPQVQQTTAQTSTSEPPTPVASMTKDQVLAELSSLNQPTGGILPVLRKRLEKARAVPESPQSTPTVLASGEQAYQYVQSPQVDNASIENRRSNRLEGMSREPLLPTEIGNEGTSSVSKTFAETSEVQGLRSSPNPTPEPRQAWEMTRSEFLDWSRTEDFRKRRSEAEQAEKSATDEVLRLEREIGVPSDSPLGLVGSSEGVSAKAFGIAQLADAARQQQAFDAALAKMPPEFRAKYDRAVRRSELAHARTRSFEDLNTAKEMAAENPELAKVLKPEPEPSPAAQDGRQPSQETLEKSLLASPNPTREPKQAWELTREEWVGGGSVGRIKFGDVDRETVTSPQFETEAEARAWAESRGIKNPGLQSSGKRGGPKLWSATGSTGFHADAVIRAHSEGKPVPANVLAEYGLSPEPSRAVPTDQSRTENTNAYQEGQGQGRQGLLTEKGAADAAPDYSTMTIAQLRDEARARGVDPKGTRAVVLKRLQDADSQTPPTAEPLLPSQTPAPETIDASRKTTASRSGKTPPDTTVATRQVLGEKAGEPEETQSQRSSPNSTPREPWQMTREEYVDANTTKHLPSDTYSESSVKPPQPVDEARFPKVVRSFKDKTGATVEIRREDRPLQYVKHDANGEIVRDAKGLALYLSDAEAAAKGLPTSSQNMVAVVDGLDVGSAFDSFGVPEVIVNDSYQRRGIGSELLKEYQKAWNRKNFGQATPQGRAMIGTLHREAVQEAHTAGKPVPPEVLKDYPDLAKQASPAPRQPIQEPAPKADGDVVARVGQAEKGKPTSQQLIDRSTELPEDTSPSGKSLQEKLTAKADEAKQRRQSRQIKRGRSTGATTVFDDVLDLAIEYGYRAAAKGIQGGRALTKFVRDTLKAEAPEYAASERDVRKIAGGLIRDSLNDSKKIDADVMERNTADLMARRAANFEREKPSIKQTIRDNTAGPKAEKNLTESQAERGKLKYAEKAAARAYREGTITGYQEGQRELGAKLKEMREARKRDRMMAGVEQRGAVDAVKNAAASKEKAMETTRDMVAGIVKDALPQSMQGKYLDAVKNAKNPAQVATVMKRVTRDLATLERRGAMSLAADSIKAAKKKSGKMLEGNRQAVEQARATVDLVRRETTVTDSVDKMNDHAAKLREAAILADAAVWNQRQSEKVRIQSKVFKREALVKGVVDGVARMRKPKAPIGGLSETPQTNLLGTLNLANATPDTMGVMFGGGPTRKMLSENLWDGESLVHRDTQAWKDAKKTLLETNGYKWGADATQRLSRSVSFREADTLAVRLPDAGRIEATPAEWMSIYATITDGDAGRWIASGAPIKFRRNDIMVPIELSTADIRAIKEAVPQAWRNIVDGGKRYLETQVRPGLFDTYRNETGFDLKAADNYFPTKRDRSALPPEEGVLSMSGVQSVVQQMTSLGFLQERTGGKLPYIIDDFFHVMDEHTRRAAVVTHMTPRVKVAELVFTDPRVKAEIVRRFGAEGYRNLSEAWQAGKLLFEEPTSKGQRVARVINRNLAKALLTLNPKTMAKQVGGIGKLYATIDAGHLAKGVATMFSDDVGAIMKSDPFFRDRYEDAIYRRMTPSLGERTPGLGQSPVPDALKRMVVGGESKGGIKQRVGGALSSRWGAFQDLTDRIELLNWFDSLSARTAIAARLEEAKGKPNTWSKQDRMDWAARMAQYDIRRTQNTNSVLDMSNFARRNRGDLMSSALMFTSDQNKSYNIIAQAYQEFRAEPSKATAGGLLRSLAAVGGNAAWATGVSAAVAAILAGGLRAKDREKKIQDAVVNQVLNEVGLPYGSNYLIDFGRAAYKAASGKPQPNFGGGMLNVPAARAGENLYGAGLQIAKIMGAEGRMQSGPNAGQKKHDVYMREFWRKHVPAITDAAGIPTGPLWRMVEQATRDAKR